MVDDQREECCRNECGEGTIIHVIINQQLRNNSQMQTQVQIVQNKRQYAMLSTVQLLNKEDRKM